MTWGKTLIVVLGAVLAVEGVRLVGAVRQQPVSRTVVVHEAAAPSRTAVADPNVANLRGRVAHLEQRVADDAAAVVSPEDESAEELAAAPRVQERRDELAQFVAAEAKDAAWSASHERAIADAFAVAELAGNRLVEADCRATMCRIVVSHEGDDARERFMSNLPFAEPFAESQGVVDPSDGTTNSVVYASRPGMNLPES